MRITLYGIEEKLYTELGISDRGIKKEDIEFEYVDREIYPLGNDIFLVYTDDQSHFEIIQKLGDNVYDSLTVEDIHYLLKAVNAIEMEE